MLIPSGWVVAEIGEGSLVYGVRKSCVYATVDAVVNYEAIVKVWQQSQKSTNRMTQLCAKMKALAK